MNNPPNFGLLRAMRLSVFPSIFACLALACGGEEKDPEDTNPSSSDSKKNYDHQDNVFSATRRWYVNPWWSEKVTREGAEAIAQHSTSVWLRSVSDIEEIAPGEVLNIPFLEDGTSPDGGVGLQEHLLEAEKQGNALVQLVLYNVPGRDCAAVLSDGELPASDYGFEVYREHYVDRIVGILQQFPHLPIAAIIEPDSITDLVSHPQDAPCQEVDNSRAYGYTNAVRHAIHELSKLDNVHLYMEVGASNVWGWDDTLAFSSLFIHGVIAGFDGLQNKADSIAQNSESASDTTRKYEGVLGLFREPPAFQGVEVAPPGYASIDGFITNVRDYVPLEEPYLGNPRLPEGAGPLRSHYFYNWNPRFDEWTFSHDWLLALEQHGGDVDGLGMLIDTSRNGWGQRMAALEGVDPNQDRELVNEYRIDNRHHRNNWCNQTGAGLGARPKANPDNKPWIDAYVWVKPPGESDGVSYGEDDPRWIVDPNDISRKHEPNCDPDELSPFGQSNELTDDLDLPTGAMPNAPKVNQWFPEGLNALITNAWPPICEGEGDICR